MRQELLSLLARHEENSSLPPTQADSGGAAFVGSEPPSDTQLGHYKLLRELGGGGMGIVYLAVRNDDVFHKTVAVKIIRPGIVQNEYLERFRRERQILAGIDHPNIARILDGGDTRDGRPFYVMEYVAGQPLDCALPERQRRPRNPPAADAAGLPGGRVPARQRDRPSRSQAGQHPHHHRRPGQGAGSRDCRSADARGPGWFTRPGRRQDQAADARLRQPGADRGHRRQQVQRRVFARRGPLPPADRAAAVRQRDR